MKTIRTILLLAVALAIVKVCHAADAKSTARFIDSITVAPVAAIKSADITGQTTLGAGLDLGASVNPFVSVHATALGFETEKWRTGVVDESEFYGKARLARFRNEAFALYGKGGAVRDWQESLWGFAVGAGAELRLNKSVGIAADYSLRAWFKDREKDALARALVNVSF
jgi:hypothetical protein